MRGPNQAEPATTTGEQEAGPKQGPTMERIKIQAPGKPAENEPDSQPERPDEIGPAQATEDTPVRQTPEVPAATGHWSKTPVPEELGPDNADRHTNQPDQTPG